MTWQQKLYEGVYENRLIQTWYDSLNNGRKGPSATKLTAFFLVACTFWPGYVALTVWSFMNDKWGDWVSVSEVVLWSIVAMLVGNIANKWVERKTEPSLQQGANGNQNPDMKDP